MWLASIVLRLLKDLFHDAGVVTMLLPDMLLKIPYWCQSPHKWCTEEPKSTHKNKLPPFPSTKPVQHFSSICSLDANTRKCIQNFTCGVIQNQSVYYCMGTWSSTRRASWIPLRGIQKSSNSICIASTSLRSSLLTVQLLDPYIFLFAPQSLQVVESLPTTHSLDFQQRYHHFLAIHHFHLILATQKQADYEKQKRFTTKKPPFPPETRKKFRSTSFHPRPLLSIPEVIPVSLTILSIKKRDRQAKKIAPEKTALGMLW